MKGKVFQKIAASQEALFTPIWKQSWVPRACSSRVWAGWGRCSPSLPWHKVQMILLQESVTERASLSPDLHISFQIPRQIHILGRSIYTYKLLCTTVLENGDRRFRITVSVFQTKSRSAEVSLINTLWEQNLQNGFLEKRFTHMLPPLLTALRNKASDVSRKLI